MKPLAFSKLNDKRGQALVELALVLPLLVLILLGLFDFSQAIHAKNIIANVSREGANMASRSALTSQDIMNAVAYTARPLDLQNKGMIYISKLEGVTNRPPTIQTQDPWQNTALKTTGRRGGVSYDITSKLGEAGDSVQSLSTLGLKDGETAYVVEVFYNYQSVFSFNSSRLASQYYSRAIF